MKSTTSRQCPGNHYGKIHIFTRVGIDDEFVTCRNCGTQKGSDSNHEYDEYAQEGECQLEPELEGGWE